MHIAPYSKLWLYIYKRIRAEAELMEKALNLKQPQSASKASYQLSCKATDWLRIERKHTKYPEEIKADHIERQTKAYQRQTNG